MTTTAYAYREDDQGALIGPLYAHEIGDLVELPQRRHAVLGHEICGGSFRIVRVEPDGVAVGRREEEARRW